MEKRRILGVDEAGKGPVIGPMVVVGVVFEYDARVDPTKKPSYLKEIEINDSKKINKKEIFKKSKQIKQKAKNFEVKIIEAPHIDRLRKQKTINEILVDAFSLILDQNDFDLAILDAADVKEKRFSKNIKERTGSDNNLISEHKADQKYPVVSAASIIAKSTRDKEIRRIEKIINTKIGEGYPNQKTKNFLKRWLSEHHELPVFCRKSWQTAKKLLETHEQSNLEEYDCQ